MTDTLLDTVEKLEAVYGTPKPASITKEISYLIPTYQAMIEASPFVVLSTVGPEGTDASPRGDPPGFVKIEDNRTVLLPDRRGNNRIDSLKNIVRDPRVSLLFLIPGVGETLRINGTAEISVDPALLESLAMDGKAPRSVIRVRIDSIYFQCQKALARSGLWDPSRQVERSSLPTAGSMLKDVTKGEFDGATYDADYPARMARELY